MNQNTYMQYLLRSNITIALGCTEPVAVALAAAKAKEVLGAIPSTVTFKLSKNIIKNAMGVGIPGTDMLGLPIAIALGTVAGKSSDELSVLSHGLHAIKEAKEWLKKAALNIECKNTPEKLYIECIAEEGENHSRVIISHTHTHFSLIEYNGKLITSCREENENEKHCEACQEEGQLSLQAIHDYISNVSVEDITWLLDAAQTNLKASEEGLCKDYGLRIGKMFLKNSEHDIQRRVIARTCAAVDARMDGATTPVYSNSGSGNQGLMCSLPVYTFAEESGITDEETIARALALCNLVSIYIKKHIGRLSALCGVVNASIGIACGMLYLQKGSFQQMEFAVKNLVNSITGMLCDGAKPSCSLKVASGIHAAFDSVELALNNIVVDETDGLAEQDVDRTILNLAKIGAKGMNETDDVILDIMTHKQHTPCQ